MAFFHSLPKNFYHTFVLTFVAILLVLLPRCVFAADEKKKNDNGKFESTSEYIVIKDINMKGNKRTKAYIILREMDVVVGDTLEVKKLEEIFEKNQNQIYNTRLFNDVNIKIASWKENLAELLVEVEERWYVIPAPIFELTDDFNVWWNVHNRDLSRTEYGMLFTHVNFRGRKEMLKLNMQFGYTKKLELSYHLPFIDKKRTTGLNPFVSYIIQRQLAYKTENNKQVFFSDTTFNRQKVFNDSTYILKRFRVGTVLTHRPNIKWQHYFNFSYFNNSIADAVNDASNGNYFLDGRTKQQYFYLAYVLNYDNRDIQAYPLKGNYFRLQVTKAGIGIFNDLNMLWIIGNYTQYMRLHPKVYAVANVQAKTSFPDIQPYFNQSGLSGGSGNIRGYELYVIDGQKYAMARTALKYQLINRKFVNPIVKLSQFRTIPFAAYLKTYAETAYVQDRYYAENNPLNNQWLRSTGVGLDIVTLYDSIFSLEYSLNHLGEWGFFMGFKVNYD